MKLNTRIQKIIEYAELTASEFADEIGVQRSNISHIISERNKPSLDFLIKIKERFPEIKWEWLIEGQGEMTNDTLPSPTPEIHASKINLDENEKLEFSSPNLFSNFEENEPQKIIPIIENTISPNPRELNIPTQSEQQKKIDDSQRLEIEEEKPIIKSIENQENKIKKIVFFYENGKFEAFEP